MGALQNVFGKFKTKVATRVQRWKEVGTYKSVFTSFGTDVYRSELVRSCIRPLAEYTAKANIKSNVKGIERLFNYRPNMYMTGHDLLLKVRTQYELKNTAFIFINRDDKGHPISYYPVPYSTFEALEYNDRLYINFTFNGGTSLMASWSDLVVLRKDYLTSDIAGEDNSPILNTLNLINVTNQGVANAVKATANLRGILKSTKAMLDTDDIRKQKENFVRDYLSLENEGGIASLDATQEFTPIKMEPTVTNYMQMKEFRENVFRYFGVNDAIIMGTATEDERESFYQSKIEPFLVALSTELTSKTFTERELGFGNYIMLESNKLQYASNATKLSLQAMVDRGAMTPNEWREVFNMAPVEGGDVPLRRLDTAQVTDVKADEDIKEGEEDNDTEGQHTEIDE